MRLMNSPACKHSKLSYISYSAEREVEKWQDPLQRRGKDKPSCSFALAAKTLLRVLAYMGSVLKGTIRFSSSLLIMCSCCFPSVGKSFTTEDYD